jgi:hypothetical protein
MNNAGQLPAFHLVHLAVCSRLSVQRDRRGVFLLPVNNSK